MDKDHVENGHIAQGVLQPELVIAEAGRTTEGEGSGGQQGKERAGEQPEINDIKQTLVFPHQHEGAEDH